VRYLVPIFFLAAFALTPVVRADIVWSSGTNTVPADTTQADSHIVITGGTNTVLGTLGPPAGANGGTLQLNLGGAGLEITGATLTLNSDDSSPGRLLVQGHVSTFAASTTALIATAGAGANAGVVDLGFGTQLFTIAPGNVPSSGPDLSITANVSSGGIEKNGGGIIALSGANTYTGGTLLDAGTFYINGATAIGSSFFTINGPNTTIDNTSGGPITLTNNNQFNLTAGDFNFTGTNDLNLGTGIFVMTNADRTVNVVNSSATLTIGGRIQDAGQSRGLTKTGTGTLVLGGNSLYTGPTNFNAGAVVLNGSLGNTTVAVGANGALINNGVLNNNVSVSGVLTGTGTIHGSLVINNGGQVNVSGGTLTVDGAITNNGLFVLRQGAQVGGLTGFVNNGTVDLTTAGAFNPPNFTNNGTIIDSSVVKAKTAARAGSTFTITIDSYTGHTYQLQKSTTTPAGANFSGVGAAKQGSTGTVLTFTDSTATGTASFYRIVVDP